MRAFVRACVCVCVWSYIPFRKLEYVFVHVLQILHIFRKYNTYVLNILICVTYVLHMCYICVTYVFICVT
jgi:hypothetical protein